MNFLGVIGYRVVTQRNDLCLAVLGEGRLLSGITQHEIAVGVKHWYVGNQEGLLHEDHSFLQVNIEDSVEVRVRDQEIVF